MASPPRPDDRAFDFDPSVVTTSRPPPLLDEAPRAAEHLSWRDLAGLMTAVAAVPAAAMILMFAAVTTYGPLYLTEPAARIAVAPAEVETTGAIAWPLRDTLDE